MVHALKSITQELPLIDTLLKVLLSENQNENLKLEALKVLLNLLPYDKSNKVHSTLLRELSNLLKKNEKLPKLFTELV